MIGQDHPEIRPIYIKTGIKKGEGKVSQKRNQVRYSK